MEIPDEYGDRLEAAIGSAEALDKARHLVNDLKTLGFTKEQILALFDASRERHERDADATQYNNVLDVMDHIVGWCQERWRLF